MTAFIALPLLHYSVNYKNFLTDPVQVLATEKQTQPNNSISLQVPREESDENARAKNLSTGIFAIFILFLVGAITSCMGGYYAICSCSIAKNDANLEASLKTVGKK